MEKEEDFHFNEARKLFISEYNNNNKLSLYSVYLFYIRKGYNKYNLSYENFCDLFEKCLTEKPERINTSYTLNLLIVFYDVKTDMINNVKILS